MSVSLLDTEPHSGESVVEDDRSCAVCVIPRVAIDFVRADGSRYEEEDCAGCLCGKCKKRIDLSVPCRFYEVRGGRHDGKRVVGHAKCITDKDAIKVSVASAVEILVRQRREQGGRVTPKKR